MSNLTGIAINDLKPTISYSEFNTVSEKSSELKKRLLNKFYEKSIEKNILSKFCNRVFCKKSSNEYQIFSMKSKRDIKDVMKNELLKQIAEVVLDLYKENKFSLKQRDVYLNSGFKFLFDYPFILQLLAFCVIEVTALEVFEGICNNSEAKKQSFCITRELQFDRSKQDIIKKLTAAGFLNKNIDDDIQLNNLKNMVKETIPDSVMEFQVPNKIDGTAYICNNILKFREN